jgi:aspartyl-tRNA(Asn)/glutamyl-tRNA(Gln) amidotransferase subunit C
MALEEKNVRYVAELAHLELSDEEVRKFLPQLDSILEYIQKLNELDTTRVDPMAQVTYPASENPALRSDQARRTFEPELSLANAPERDAGCFKVPQVIEKED